MKDEVVSIAIVIITALVFVMAIIYITEPC